MRKEKKTICRFAVTCVGILTVAAVLALTPIGEKNTNPPDPSSENKESALQTEESSCPVQSVLYYGTVRLGPLKDGENLDELQDAAEAQLGTSYPLTRELELKEEETEEPAKERDELLSFLEQAVKSDYTDACGVFVSGQFAGALSDEEEEDATLRTNDLEQEFIFHYFTTVNRMKEVMKDARIEMKIDTFFRLLKRVTDTITIPFHGEPLSGLQIMGVLETRALDFDRLIILSMNEGIFPQRKAANSFIPYNLRRGFGLPTYEHQDSVWAYHFYRLIERASHVSLLYDTRSNGLQTGEVSRFVHQLHYHYEVPMRDKLVVYNVSSSKTPPLAVPKREDIMRRLDAYRKGGSKAISASAINTYLDCPLKFYFSVVEGIR